MYGVFDGHGPCGHDASAFCHRELPLNLLSDPLLRSDVSAALKNAFLAVGSQASHARARVSEFPRRSLRSGERGVRLKHAFFFCCGAVLPDSRRPLGIQRPRVGSGLRVERQHGDCGFARRAASHSGLRGGFAFGGCKERRWRWAVLSLTDAKQRKRPHKQAPFSQGLSLGNPPRCSFRKRRSRVFHHRPQANQSGREGTHLGSR